MEKHPTEITTLVPSKEMGRQLMALRYDLLLPVLHGMLQECNRQHTGDMEKERYVLAGRLEALGSSLDDCIDKLSSIVRVCRLYIEEEKYANQMDKGTDR